MYGATVSKWIRHCWCETFQDHIEISELFSQVLWGHYYHLYFVMLRRFDFLKEAHAWRSTCLKFAISVLVFGLLERKSQALFIWPHWVSLTNSLSVCNYVMWMPVCFAFLPIWDHVNLEHCTLQRSLIIAGTTACILPVLSVSRNLTCLPFWEQCSSTMCVFCYVHIYDI